jgi:phosphoenolpyruvate carboxykinase (ATP)
VAVDNIVVFNSVQDAEAFGFRNLKKVYWNFKAPALYERSLTRGEINLIAKHHVASTMWIAGS